MYANKEVADLLSTHVLHLANQGPRFTKASYLQKLSALGVHAVDRHVDQRRRHGPRMQPLLQRAGDHVHILHGVPTDHGRWATLSSKRLVRGGRTAHPAFADDHPGSECTLADDGGVTKSCEEPVHLRSATPSVPPIEPSSWLPM